MGCEVDFGRAHAAVVNWSGTVATYQSEMLTQRIEEESRQERDRKVTKALWELDDEELTLLSLRLVFELSYGEIAEGYEVTHQAIRARIVRLCNRVYEALTRC
jgi:DNA-directed RNA polymerase specialized sigma24 family protein